MAYLDRFCLRMMLERKWRLIKSITSWFSKSSGGHSMPVMACIEKSNGSNKAVQLPIRLISLWNGWIVALQVDWSADVASQNGHRIHQIWIFVVFKRPYVPEQSTNNCRTQGSYYSADPWHNKGRTCQGNRQLCSTAPSMISAPRRTFRTCHV